MNQTSIDFEAAAARRDTGIQSSIDHAGPTWAEWATWYLEQYARTHLEPFTIEMMREWAHPLGLPVPDELRAFGAVTQRAIKNGTIKATGQYAKAKSSNCSPKMLYRATDSIGFLARSNP